MYTQCPVCKTVFRLQIGQLNAAKGQVRCSRCLATFDALDNLFTPPEEDSRRGTTANPRAQQTSSFETVKPDSSSAPDKSETRPEMKSASRYEQKPQPKPGDRRATTSKPETKSSLRSESVRDSKSAPRYEPKTASRPASRPEPQTTPRPAPRPEPKPAPRPAPRPEPKPAPRPAPRPEPKPAPRPAPRPEPKPAPRPAPRPETKPAPRPAPRPEPKPAPRPAPRPEPKPAPRPAPRPEAKPAPRPAPRPEAKPAPRPAPRPEPKLKTQGVQKKAEHQSDLFSDDFPDIFTGLPEQPAAHLPQKFPTEDTGEEKNASPLSGKNSESPSADHIENEVSENTEGQPTASTGDKEITTSSSSTANPEESAQGKKQPDEPAIGEAEIKGENKADEEAIPVLELDTRLIEEEPAAVEDYTLPPELEPTNHRSSLLASMVWMLGILVMLGGLVLQYVYYHRTVYAANPQLRPVLSRLCDLTGCKLPPRRDLSAIVLGDHLIQSHPRYQNSLLITATLINHADFAQPYPVLEMIMTDLEQNEIARRRFLPREYLVGTNGSKLFPPGSEVPVMLEVIDPGKQAVGFEFNFY